MSVHHYVIKFDTETKSWDWDTDTEATNFIGGCIYLPELDKWVSSGYSTEIHDSDNEISEQLSKAIFWLNKIGTEG